MPAPSSVQAVPDIRAQLLSEVQDQSLELPALPESNARIQRLTEGDALDLRKFSHAIALDPGVAFQFLRAANSEPFCSQSPTGSLCVAIRQLGLQHAMDVARGLSNRLAFQPTNEMIERRYRLAVADATYVSAASAVLARNYTEIPVERARVAGLFYNVGAFPILAQAEYQNFTDAFALHEIVEAVQVVLSSSILKRWNFPSEIAELPAGVATYTRPSSGLILLDVVAAGVALNSFFNHTSQKQVSGGHESSHIRVLPPALSLLIYEIAGFDPVANSPQLDVLRDEIAVQLNGDF